MQLLKLIAPVAAVALSACAQPGTTNAVAEQAQLQCSYLARDAGLRVTEYTSVQALAASHQVKMKVEDRVGRRVDASCEVAGGKAKWMEALPAGMARL